MGDIEDNQMTEEGVKYAVPLPLSHKYREHILMIQKKNRSSASVVRGCWNVCVEIELQRQLL